MATMPVGGSENLGLDLDAVSSPSGMSAMKEGIGLGCQVPLSRPFTTMREEGKGKVWENLNVILPEQSAEVDSDEVVETAVTFMFATTASTRSITPTPAPVTYGTLYASQPRRSSVSSPTSPRLSPSVSPFTLPELRPESGVPAPTRVSPKSLGLSLKLNLANPSRPRPGSPGLRREMTFFGEPRVRALRVDEGEEILHEIWSLLGPRSFVCLRIFIVQVFVTTTLVWKI
jgi:hypothetical protein